MGLEGFSTCERRIGLSEGAEKEWGSNTPKKNAKKKIPDKWQLLRYDDISYANRKRARVQGLIINGPLDEIEIALAGHDALAFANKYMPGVQGVALFLWADREKVGKEEALVSIHWCPHGKWEWIGEYPVTDNIFAIEFNKQGGEDAEDSDSSEAGRSPVNPS